MPVSGASTSTGEPSAACEGAAREAVKYRSLFEHSLDAVYLARQDGTILDANPAACRLHGMTVDEIRQAGRAGLVVTDERHAAALKARAERGHVRAEMAVRRKDGTTVDVEVESVLLDPGRPGSDAFVISRDVSERRRAEDALRRSEARAMVVAENVSNSLVVLGAVRGPDGAVVDWRYVDANEGAAKVLGTTRDRVIGARVSEHLPGRMAAILERAARVLATGAAERYETEHGDRALLVTMFRVDADTVGAGALDVSSWRRAEREAAAALRRAEEERRRLSAVLDALPAGVALADATGKIVQFNAALARIWGSPPLPQSADEYRGWRGRWLDSGKPLEPGEWAMARALFRGEVVVPGDVVEIEKFDGSGTAIIVNAAAPIRAEDGTIVGGVLAEVDITEQKRAEAALREANERLRDADRRKDEFLGMLSHELRNPLAPIRNALYILDHAPPAGEQARRAKEVARRQITHITRLVDDLLDVTRIARGRIELRRADLDLGAVARRTADDYRSLLSERGLALDVDVPGERVEVNGDETRLAQILGNLLSNAAKFTPAGGTVGLSVRAEGDRAVVHVRDTGPGIAPEVLGMIFEPFTQAKQSLARSEGGLGLGLALVKSLVELHGGEVRVASEGAGRGSDFTVTLPLAQASRPSR